MPWSVTCTMEQKMKFIVAWEQQHHNFSQLCRGFNISTKTGYKWIARYKAESIDGLKDRSRAPHNPHNKTPTPTQHTILETKLRYPTWGPRKILDYLSQEYPDMSWPAVSTAGELLKRHGMVKTRKKRQRVTPYTDPFMDCEEPNDVWSLDFKGQFRVGNKQLCYPFTISDNYSRCLLGCDGFSRISGQGVKNSLENLFKENGLPKAIRSDNGSPFAGRGLGGLSLFSVWLTKLGIVHERIRVGHPEENGRHERMHRTLKEETTNPVEGDLFLQQLRFNRFRQMYNEERPHEGLGGQRPAWLYEPSSRCYPYYLEEIVYGRDYETRVIRQNGTMKWDGKEIFISETLRGERIGLLPMNELEWKIYYSTIGVGIFNEKTRNVSNLK